MTRTVAPEPETGARQDEQFSQTIVPILARTNVIPVPGRQRGGSLPSLAHLASISAACEPGSQRRDRTAHAMAPRVFVRTPPRWRGVA